MNRTVYWLAGALWLSLMTITFAGAQDLGDLGRKQRQAKRPTAAKVYTNDDFAAVTLSNLPAESNKNDSADKDNAAAKADDKAKRSADFKAKAEEQKKSLAQMERELDVMQREYRLKVAVYYSDAGNSLRDSKKWAEEDRKQRADIETKQKAVTDAKQKLADLQEQARRAGTRIE